MKYSDILPHLQGTFRDIWPVITSIDTVHVVEKLIEYESKNGQRESVLFKLRARQRKLMRRDLEKKMPR